MNGKPPMGQEGQGKPPIDQMPEGENPQVDTNGNRGKNRGDKANDPAIQEAICQKI